MKKYAFYIVGIFSGFINGILGTGGGTVVVPCIEWLGMDIKILNLSIINGGKCNIKSAFYSVTNV